MGKKSKARPSGKSLPPSSRSGRPSAAVHKSVPRSSHSGISSAFLPSADVLPAADSSVAVASVPRSAPPAQKPKGKKQTLILPSDESALSVPPSHNVEHDFTESSFFSSPPSRISVLPPELEVELARPSLRVARLMSEEAHAARARYRRWVSYAIGACVVFLGVAWAAAVTRGREPDAPPPPLPYVQPVAIPEPSPEQAAVAAAAAAPPPAAAALDSAALRRKASRALDSGKLAEARALATEAIEAAPEHAEGYLLLGAAFETSGDVATAREHYKHCAEVATKGPRAECQNLARR